MNRQEYIFCFKIIMDRLRFTVLSTTLPSRRIEPMDARTRKYIYHGYITKLPYIEPCRIDSDCIDGQICNQGVCVGLHLDHMPHIISRDDYETWIRTRLMKNYTELHWGHNIPMIDYEYDYDYS